MKYLENVKIYVEPSIKMIKSHKELLKYDVIKLKKKKYEIEYDLNELKDIIIPSTSMDVKERVKITQTVIQFIINTDRFVLFGFNPFTLKPKKITRERTNRNNPNYIGQE